MYSKASIKKLVCIYYLDLSIGQEVVNHPVHIINHLGDVSPSAFIPFCSFGFNKVPMGKKIELFDEPVCTAFRIKRILKNISINQNKRLNAILLMFNVPF